MKKLVASGILVVFLGSIFFFISNTYKKDIRETINKVINPADKKDDEIVDKNISLDITPKSISIIKTGNPVRKKVITVKEDMDKVISFVNSIHLEKKLKESFKGWSYSIDITDTDDKNYGLTIGSYVSYDDSQYTIDPSVTDKLDSIYKELNYPEVDPLK